MKVQRVRFSDGKQTWLVLNDNYLPVEPILASTLPGPLGNLRFTKIDFGHIPIGFSNVDVHKTKTDGIKLDMDMDWEGVCDFELDGKMVPKVVCFEYDRRD